MIVSTRLDTQIEESFQSSDIFFEKIKEMDVNHTNDIVNWTWLNVKKNSQTISVVM